MSGSSYKTSAVTESSCEFDSFLAFYILHSLEYLDYLVYLTHILLLKKIISNVALPKHSRSQF